MGGTDWLKRELLMHDKIGLINLSFCMSELRHAGKFIRADTYEYLQDANVIYEAFVPELTINSEVELILKEAKEACSKFEQALTGLNSKAGESSMVLMDKVVDAYRILYSHFSRAVAADLQSTQMTTAIPFLTSRLLQEKSIHLHKTPVIRAIVNQIPVPSGIVPLEEILELRQDSEFIEKRNRLWSWIRNFSNEGWTEQEVREEVIFLTAEYKKYMKLHKVKYDLVSVEAFVKLGASIVEDTCKLRFKDLTETLFSIRGENVNLSIAELDAPGRELALIPYLETKSNFNNA